MQSFSKRVIGCLALILCGAAIPAQAFSLDDPPGPQFTLEQKQVQIRAGADVNARIMDAYKGGAASVTIPPGDYRFGKEHWGPHGVIYPLEIDGIHRDAEHPFTIDAKGVTFWFDLPDDEDPTAHFALGLKDCSNVILKNLTIDRATRGDTEGRITQIDTENHRIEIQLSAKSWVPTRFSGALEQRILPFKADGTFCAPLYALQSGGVHLGYKAIVPETKTGRYWVEMVDNALLTTILDPRWNEAYGSQGVLRVGDGLCCLYTVSIGIALVNCSRITVDGLKDYITKGGPSETGGYGAHIWKDCYFGPRPGTNEWQGGDGFMCNALQHGSTFDNVTILHSTDDPINIHGYWGSIQATAGNAVTFGSIQDAPPSFEADTARNDTILFYDRDTAEPRGSAVAQAMDGRTVTLDRDAAPFANCIAEWPGRECAGWVIENCDWHDDYQRVLIQSGPGTIRNCKFTRLGSRIQLESVFGTRNEGGIPHDITITGCTFTDVSPMPHGQVIGMYLLADRTPTVDPIRNLRISNNRFVRPGEIAISLQNSSDDVVSNNTIVDPIAYTARATSPAAHRKQPILLNHCIGVRLNGNDVSDPGNYTEPDAVSGSSLLGIEDGCENIVLDGRRLR